MNKFFPLISAALIMTSCTKAAESPKQLPIVEMVATHAIDTKTQITALTFIPNNVAPWLGRIIMLDENEHLFSTDIEGRTPLAVNPKTYTGIAGLFRENAAGVFLAIGANGKLEAFIQSDDAGNFMSLPISGTGINTSQFCKSSVPIGGSIKLLSTDGRIIDLEISIADNVLEYTEASSSKAEKNDICAANAGISTIQLKFTDAEYTGKADGSLRVYQDGGPNHYTLKINDGLSIKGLEAIDYINATTANYGGGAFKDGVIALIDKNKPRIVFVSLEYAGGKIAGAGAKQAQ